MALFVGVARAEALAAEVRAKIITGTMAIVMEN